MCATEAHGGGMADGIKVSLVTANIMESKRAKLKARIHAAMRFVPIKPS